MNMQRGLAEPWEAGSERLGGQASRTGCAKLVVATKWPPPTTNPDPRVLPHQHRRGDSPRKTPLGKRWFERLSRARGWGVEGSSSLTLPTVSGLLIDTHCARALPRAQRSHTREQQELL